MRDFIRLSTLSHVSTLSTLSTLSHLLFEPGLFTSSPVRVAIAIGTIVAVVSGPVGVFTVMRGQSFAGHALSDVATTGGSGAFLIGITPLWGFVALGVLAAGVMEMIGVQRARSRDVATGIVLGAGLGLAALFLFLDSTVTNTTGAAITILFGSIFTVDKSVLAEVAAFSLISLGIIALIYRPLLLGSISPDIASSRGVRVRVIGLLYLLALALSVALSSVTIGAILSTALLIGPAATALALTKRPGSAVIVACLSGVLATWIGIVAAYDSFYWPPHGHGWPVSFFIVAIIFIFYLLSRLYSGFQGRGLNQSRSPSNSQLSGWV